MNDEVLTRAAQIYADAADLKPADRDAFLSEVCRGDDKLLVAVESLFSHADKYDSFASGLVSRVGSASFLDSRSTGKTSPLGEVGHEIGPYRLVEPIGEGGMGSVWLAERNDGQYEARVAIKLLRGPAVRADGAALRDEAQHLATLSHPNIAGLIDAGMDNESQPYLILEFVDGTALDQYCSERGADVEARIRLFLDVLDAVAHAHSHLIVHRDIKPSNVLVSREGQVKLLDFGTSQLVDATQARPADGEAGPVAVTPDYAAPEQFGGGAVTTATDVYSLGLVLCHLLTGKNPRDISKARTLPELITSSQQPYGHASTLTPDAALERQLKGELDAILAKALAPDPRERYASAREFALDLERFLSDEPVSAVPVTTSYRARKFFKRNRAGVAVVLLVVGIIIAASVMTTLQMFEARTQRDIAVYQQRRVQASNEFYGLLLEEFNAQGDPFTPVELLDRAAALLDAQYGSDAEFLGRPYHDVIQRYRAIGEHATAEAMLDEAILLAEAQGDEDLLAALRCSGAATALQVVPAATLARVERGIAYMANRPDASIDDRAQCWVAESMIHYLAGDMSQAAFVLQNAAAELRASPAASISSLTTVLNRLLQIYYAQGDFDSLLVTSRVVEEINRANGRDHTFGQLIVLSNRATIHGMLGEYVASAELHARIVEDYRSIAPSSRGSWQALQIQGVQLMQGLRFEESRRILEGLRSSMTSNENPLAYGMVALGLSRLYSRTGRVEVAIEHLQQAEESLRNASKPLGRNLRRARVELEIARGNFAAADEMLNGLLRSMGYPENMNHAGLSATLQFAIQVALGESRFGDAERMASDKLEIDLGVARSPELSGKVGQSYLLRARARLGLGRRAEAREDLLLALPSLEGGFGEGNPASAEAMLLLAEY